MRWFILPVMAAASLGVSGVLAQTTPAAPATAPAPAAAPVAPTTATTAIALNGLLGAGRSYVLADLQALPSREVTVTYTSGSGENLKTNTHRFRGAALYDLIMAARPQFNSAVKNDALHWIVRAVANDGYSAVFALGELDPAFGNKGVLLAYEQDGKPLPAGDGAVRLVVPGDGKGGRYVSNLVEVQVFRADR